MTTNPLMWQGGDPDSAYLDKTLRHGPVEVYFDEGVTFRSIFTLWLRATLCSLPFALVWLVLVLISLFSLAGAHSAYSSYASDSAEGPVTVGTVLLCFAPLVWLVVFALSRVAEPLGEWRVVLADRAGAAEQVYSVIEGKLQERQLPLTARQSRRNATGFGAVQNRLMLFDGPYRVYVSVFPYGTSLYLGWIMYRHRSGGELVGRFLADLFASLAGRLDDIGRMLRTERPRALREVAHALCREGLNVAVQRIEVPLQYGFPHGLPPVEPLPGTSYQQPPTGAWPAQYGTPG